MANSATQVLEAAKREQDPDDAAGVVTRAIPDRVSLARQLWEWTRAGALNTAASLRFWRVMAADATAFTATDFLGLLEKIGEQPDCAGLTQRGRVLPAGWRKELDELFAVVRSDSATLISGLSRLEEPLHGGLAFALARERLLPVDQVPRRVLVETATKMVLGDFSVRRELLEQRLPWPPAALAEAAAEVLIDTSPSERVDELQDFLADATPATQRRLFELRGFGVMGMAVKAAAATRSWLPEHLDSLMAVTDRTHVHELHLQAALATWAHVFPPMSLPPRFEGLAAEVMAKGVAGEDLVSLLAVVAQESRERILLGLSRTKGLLDWLDAATLVPTPPVLNEAVEFACRDLLEMEADPEFKSDLPEYLGDVASSLAGLGAAIAPMLESARKQQPAKSAASKVVTRALADLSKQ